MLKVEVDKKEITPVLSMVQSIVDKKTIMNIINNVLITAEDGNLSVEATDLEISYRTSIDADVKEPGAITVSAKKIYEIVRELQTDVVKIEEIDNNWLRIYVDDKAEYKIAGLPPDDFPKFRTFSQEGFISLDSGLIKELISKTIYSVSYDDRKYALSGILMEMEKRPEQKTCRIAMVSSDGHRLSLMEKEIELSEELSESIDDLNIIIPRKGAAEIKKFCDVSDKINLKVEENFLYCTAGNNQLTIRLIDGTFPDYKAIIPEEQNNVISFNRLEVLGAIRRISILSSDAAFRGVKMSIDGDVMELESLDKKLGQASETLTVSYRGEPMVVAFNAKYIEDTLKIMKSETAFFIIKDEDSPCIIKGSDDEGFLALVMPMSLDEE